MTIVFITKDEATKSGVDTSLFFVVCFILKIIPLCFAISGVNTLVIIDLCPFLRVFVSELLHRAIPPILPFQSIHLPPHEVQFYTPQTLLNPF